MHIIIRFSIVFFFFFFFFFFLLLLLRSFLFLNSLLPAVTHKIKLNNNCWTCSCWAWWSLVLFDPVWQPDPNNVEWFLMGDLLVLSCFVEIKNCSRTLYSSQRIVKFLQLWGRRQIAEPRKYCLVRVIVFLWRVFSLIFFFLISWEFGFIPYNWYQSLGLGLSGRNGKGSRKGV